jgi:hypothetical protein
MKIIAVLAPRDIEGADSVLEGFVVELASGNVCRIWPALTEDLEHNQTRIAFFTELWREPTPADTAEIMAITDDLMGGPPALFSESLNPCDTQANLEWLRSGKVPPKPRTN